MMHGKAIWKSGIGEMAKMSRDLAPGPHRGGGAYSTSYNFPVSYGNKTQSVMKSEGHQKCLGKALNGFMVQLGGFKGIKTLKNFGLFISGGQINSLQQKKPKKQVQHQHALKKKLMKIEFENWIFCTVYQTSKLLG